MNEKPLALFEDGFDIVLFLVGKPAAMFFPGWSLESEPVRPERLEL